MKRVKMLLVAMLCVVMAFGAASVPASAEIIEGEKPAEPREVSVESINPSKKAYHTDDNIELVIKFKDLTKEDIENIKSCVIHIGELSQGHYFDSDLPIAATYNKTINGFIGIINKKIALKEMDYILNIRYTMHFLYKDSNNLIKIKENSYNSKRITFTVNNNCADGNHTIYKDNWVENKTHSPCTESWDKTISCNICHQVVYRKIIPALGHDISEWILMNNPTLSQNGLEEKICKRCGIVLQSRIIPKLTPTSKLKLTPTSKLKFKKKSITIKKGKSIRLKYTRKPANAQDILSWKSSKSKVVKILKNGRVKGLKKGKSVITLKTNTGKKAKITIKVK